MQLGAPAANGEAVALVERLRGVHLRMLDAVLGGDGLARVAALAAEATGAAVAIVIPRASCAVRAPEGATDELAGYIGAKLAGSPAPVPAGVGAEVPVASGDEPLGAVLLLGAGETPHAPEVLHLAAVACLTELAVQDARDEVEGNLRGSFLEDLRSGRELVPAEVLRRAARLGCDVTRGAAGLCAELDSDRPRLALATVRDDHPGALAQVLDGRVYALVPAAPGTADDALAAARRIATRLERHGLVGLSSFYAEPATLGRALQEAELILDVGRRSSVALDDDGPASTYRLLFRVLASHPEDLHAFYEDTVAPLVRYDERYRTDLMATLEAYLAHDGAVSATAQAIFAHRHTVSYRLERIRDLTGLDPGGAEDRERLGLGCKARRLLGPRLPS
jgi:sugar diacid utilization regulator